MFMRSPQMQRCGKSHVLEAPSPILAFHLLHQYGKPLVSSLKRSFQLQAARLNANLHKEDDNCSCGPDDVMNEEGSLGAGTPERSQGSREKGKEFSSRMKDSIGLFMPRGVLSSNHHKAIASSSRND